MGRKNLGRRKVEMVKMTNEANLQVTFSKRRSGLFKKASELCTLCDAEIALIVFSPSGKVFSFGHPDINVLLHHSSGRILTHNNTNLDESNRKPYIQMLSDRFSEVMAEKEKKQRNKATIVQNERKNKNPENWWRNSPNELNLSQLTCLKHVLEDLKREVDEITSPFHQKNPNYYVGNSSNAAPAIINGGNISTNQDLFDRNGMITPIHTLPFGFNVMNRTPAGYNHSQIQNQEFKQAHPHPHHGPRYY